MLLILPTSEKEPGYIADIQGLSCFGKFAQLEATGWENLNEIPSNHRNESRKNHICFGKCFCSYPLGKNSLATPLRIRDYKERTLLIKLVIVNTCLCPVFSPEDILDFPQASGTCHSTTVPH